MGLLTPPEMARKVGQICTAASSLTVFADADSGKVFGLAVRTPSREMHLPDA